MQRPSITGAHESARHRAGVLAALEYRSSSDESGLVALDTLDEARRVLVAIGEQKPDQAAGGCEYPVTVHQIAQVKGSLL
jgi:hypothetical protein